MDLTKIDLFNSYLIIFTGVLQFIATPIFFKTIEEPSFRFFNGGITLLLLGFINVLRIKYAIKVDSIRKFTILANLIVLLFWLSMLYFLFYKFVKYPFAFVELLILVISLLFSLRKPKPVS